MKHFASLVAVCAVMLATSACIHKSGGKISPWERVMTTSAAFAQLNHDSAVGVMQLQNSGIATAAQIRPVLEFEELVARDHQQISAILAQGPDVATSSEKLTSLLNEIKSAGSQLVASGGLGIKNPKTQQVVSSDLVQLLNLAQAILDDVKAAKKASLEPMVPDQVLQAGGFNLADPNLVANLIALFMTLGPLAVGTFLKLESLLTLGPDEKKNIADALAASDVADQDAIDQIEAWKKANGFSPQVPETPKS